MMVSLIIKFPVKQNAFHKTIQLDFLYQIILINTNLNLNKI